MRAADLALLVSLDALIEERNVTRAAARLHLSQPALSAQLARLRDLFGDQLLVPAEQGRGMVPTARALELQAPLHEALQQLDHAVRRPTPFDPRTAERTFTVAGNDNSVVMTMLDVVREAERIGSPGLRFAFRMPELDRLVTQMERGEIDLFVGGSRFVPDALRARPLIEVRHRMAQRKGHPRGRGPLDLAGYCALRHILVSTNGTFHGFMDELLEERGLRRSVAVSVAQYNLVPPILAATDLVCTLPSRFLERFDDQLDTFELPLETRDLAVSIAWHPRSDNDQAHRWLREQVSAAARQEQALRREE